MKKFWKNLCACSMLFACGMGVSACGPKNTLVSSDLDGDGVISPWENVFDREAQSTFSGVIPAGEIKTISSAEELLSINDNVNEDGTRPRYIYVLQRDLDMGGREVSINLGNSEFYGNNHIIYNFTLGKISDTEGTGNTVVSTSVTARCLFYNGTGVNNLRLYMGVAEFSPTEPEEGKRQYYFSPFYNVSSLDTVQVKGFVKISIPSMFSATVYSTLLGTCDTAKAVSIKNCSVEGKIFASSKEDSGCSFVVGGIADFVSAESSVQNCKVSAEIEVTSPTHITTGGVVAQNNGFVSSCNFDGSIKTFVLYSTSDSNVGGIVGINGPVAEVKNCKNLSSSSMAITFSPESTSSASLQANYHYHGGIVGSNHGGIIELCSSDASISVSEINTITVGSICGYSAKGIISYVLAKGKIDIKNVTNITTAQVCGKSNLGLMEKIVITTDTNIENQTLQSVNNPRVNVGMVTTFEENNDLTNFSASPYFSRVLVDGSTVVNVAKGKTVNYKLGLRNNYQIEENDSTVEGGKKYTTVVPWLFNELHYVNGGNTLNIYTVDENGTKEIVPLENTLYPTQNGRSFVTSISATARNLIDLLDFKSFLNHEEVVIKDKIIPDELEFDISPSKAETSYFGETRNNEEFAVFDREFTQSFLHTPNSTSTCDADDKDEMLSFLYYLIRSGSGNGSDYFAIKVSSDYLAVADEDKGTTFDYGMNARTRNFCNFVESCFRCLSTTAQVTYFDKNLQDIDSSVINGDPVKYIRFTCSDGTTSYSFTFDVSILQDGLILSSDNQYRNYEGFYIMYMNFTISSKPGV